MTAHLSPRALSVASIVLLAAGLGLLLLGWLSGVRWPIAVVMAGTWLFTAFSDRSAHVLRWLLLAAAAAFAVWWAFAGGGELPSCILFFFAIAIVRWLDRRREVESESV
jgi:hypothetical protein